jgi:MFS family permease
MNRSLARTDALAIGLLLLWTGMVLGFALLIAPLLFSSLPSRDLAGGIAGKVVGRLDWAGWAAFLGALVLVILPRWTREIGDPKERIGPQRLWTAAILAALIINFASQAIVSPNLARVHARMDAPVETLPLDHPDRVAYRRVHGLSVQLMVFRILLALGLAAGVPALPRERREGED